MEVLNLTLKKKWFDMIASGEKTEEYREVKDYWARRMVFFFEEMEWDVLEEMVSDMRKPYRRHNGPEDLLQYFGVKFRKFDAICFRNGYGATVPQVTVECNGVSLSKGKPEWGAEPGKFYFTLRLGKTLG